MKVCLATKQDAAKLRKTFVPVPVPGANMCRAKIVDGRLSLPASLDLSVLGDMVRSGVFVKKYCPNVPGVWCVSWFMGYWHIGRFEPKNTFRIGRCAFVELAAALEHLREIGELVAIVQKEISGGFESSLVVVV